MSTQVAVVTTTFSKTVKDLRLQLAIRTVREIKNLLGYGPIIVDASPDPVKLALEEAGGQVYQQRPDTTMGSARRQAVSQALSQGAETIIWMEPEKYPLVESLPRLVEFKRLWPYDLVIPRRASLRSYPAYQMAKELEGNHEAGSLTGRPDLDLWFGPRVMDRRAAELFCSYDGRYGDRWESIFIPVMMSLRKGLHVTGHTVDYIHPPEQTASESGPDMDQKRDDQLNSLLAAMDQYWLDSTPALSRES